MNIEENGNSNSRKRSTGRRLKKIKDQSPFNKDLVDKLENDLVKNSMKVEKKEAKAAVKKTKKTSKPVRKAKKTKPAENKTLFSDDKDLPLSDRTVVITGVFESIKDRSAIKECLQSLGAKVTSSVSGKTDLLLYGPELEDGRTYDMGNKYKKATEKGTNTMSEAEFNEEIFKLKQLHLIDLIKGAKSDNIKTAISAKKKKFDLNTSAKKGRQRNNDMVEDKTVKNSFTKSGLWSDKYAPQFSYDIIGNDKLIEKLVKWLEHWGADSEPSKKGKGKPKAPMKACLISGSPGIGKTTAAKIIAKESGYDTVIQNASDLRNKNSINKLLTPLIGNSVICQKKLEKCVIIMDEVDGMRGSDRGGIQALIALIKKTESPIICICNDRMNPKIKTLAKYCLDLRFAEPTEIEIMYLIEVILDKEFGEGFFNTVNSDDLRKLILTAQCDIRQVLNQLQMWINEIVSQRNEEAGVKGTKDSISFSNPFDASKILLNTNIKQEVDIRQLKSLFFVDYNLIHHFVFEHYLTRMTKHRAKLEDIDKALESFTEGDYCEKLIQSDRDYSLLGPLSFFSAIQPSLLIERGIGFCNFPQALSQGSSMKKRERLLKELRDSFSKNGSFLNDQGVIDYCQVLYELIGQLMNNNRFDELFNLYKLYDLDTDKVNENLCALVVNGKDKGIDSVSRASKGKFTKFYKSQFESKNSKKGTKKGKKAVTKSKVESESDSFISESPEEEEIENYMFD